MDTSIDKKIEFKERTISFLKNNKSKILLFGFALIFVLIILIFLNEKNKNENIIISENYIKANLLLSDSQSEEAKIYFDKIILSENKFYALLALNKVLEKNLITDKEKILTYFKTLEKKNYSTEYKDLILFKKSLYLAKIKESELSQKILNNLINKNSKLKSAAQELIK